LNLHAMLYNLIFIVRRIILVLALIFLPDYGLFQVFLHILMSVGMLVYSFTVRPFAEPGLNAQECINETITLVTAYMMVLFTNLVPNTARVGGMNVKTAIGWFMIGVIGLAIIINLFLIIKTTVNEFKEKARTRKIQSMMLLKFEHLNKR